MTTSFPTKKNAIKALAKTLSVSELRLAIQVFDEVATRIEQRERQAEIKALQKRMAEMGLSPSDLTSAQRKPRSKAASQTKAAKVAPKYSLTVDGDVVYWSGRGRRPRPFQEYIDQGGNIEALLIEGSKAPAQTTAKKAASSNKSPTKRRTGPKSKATSA